MAFFIKGVVLLIRPIFIIKGVFIINGVFYLIRVFFLLKGVLLSLRAIVLLLKGDIIIRVFYY